MLSQHVLGEIWSTWYVLPSALLQSFFQSCFLPGFCRMLEPRPNSIGESSPRHKCDCSTKRPMNMPHKQLRSLSPSNTLTHFPRFPTRSQVATKASLMPLSAATSKRVRSSTPPLISNMFCLLHVMYPGFFEDACSPPPLVIFSLCFET